MNTPCYKCLMVPVCKDKEYLDLMKCVMIRHILYNEKIKFRVAKIDRAAEFHMTILDTIEVLKPSRWYYDLNSEKHPSRVRATPTPYVTDDIRNI